jgi:uncharacterized membrane protein YhhN
MNASFIPDNNRRFKNTKSVKKFTFLYIFLALAELLAIYFEDQIPNLEWLTKPALLSSLALFVWFTTQGITCRFKTFLIAALIFSWFGDVFLMVTDLLPSIFVAGLFSFLISHVLYIIAFNQNQHPPKEVPLIRKHPWIIFVLIVYGIYMFNSLKSDLGSLIVPVLVYIVVILTMMLYALNRYGKVSIRSFMWVSAGAFLFVISDSLLAINKFADPFDGAHFWVMITYMAAQYSIVRGGWLQIRAMG